MHSMTIGRKIVLTSGVLIALCVVQAMTTYFGLSNAITSAHEMTEQSIPGLAATNELTRSIFLLRGNYMQHLASGPADFARIEHELDDNLAASRKAISEYQIHAKTEADRENITKLSSLFDQYVTAWQSVLPLSRAEKNTEALDLFHKTMIPVMNQIKVMLPEMAKVKSTDQERAAEKSLSTLDHTVATLVAVCLGTVGLGVFVAFWMIRGINGSLRQTVHELEESAVQIEGAASQVASSSQALAEGTSEQAATIEETSSASAEINSMAQRNTENSRTTADLVTGSQARFEETNKSLAEMVEAMEGITASSQKISKIIKVIDEIAFQTNILALNAAVEAARAGDAGMGFAVVADEVRSLAQRSAQAAKDTASLIEESIERSNGGKAKVDQVATSIRTVTAESSKIKVLVDEINLGSVEQSRGVDQISRSITEMEKVTQSGAANAEEGAASAAELASQAKGMRETILGLKAMVEGGGAAAAAPARKVVAAKPAVKFTAAKAVAARPAMASANSFPMDDDFKSF